MNSIKLININSEEWTKIEGFSSKGKRVKSWYENINEHTTYLYKEPKIYNSTGFVTKEIWTEFIAYKIGTFLGLDIPEAIPATDGTNYGILIKSFLKQNNTTMPEIELAEAQDILSQFNIKLYHNLDTIKFLLTNEQLTENSWKKFKEMLVFDCIIGNNDRHDENWGILYGSAINKYRFAPIYDNASCLTYGDNEEKVLELLNDAKKLEIYINNSKPPNLFIKENNNRHYKHFEIMAYLLKNEDDMFDIIKNMVDKDCLSYTKNVLNEIIHLDIPKVHSLSDNRKKLIIKILECRIQKLKDIIKYVHY